MSIPKLYLSVCSPPRHHQIYDTPRVSRKKTDHIVNSAKFFSVLPKLMSQFCWFLEKHRTYVLHTRLFIYRRTEWRVVGGGGTTINHCILARVHGSVGLDAYGFLKSHVLFRILFRIMIFQILDFICVRSFNLLSLCVPVLVRVCLPSN